MARTLGARHLSNNRHYQPQMTNNFEVQFEGLGEDFTLCAVNCNLPEPSNPPVELSYGNSKAKVAGQAEYGDGTFEVMDAIKADVEKIINDWQKKVYDPETDRMGWVDEYKKDGTVTQFGPDGTYERTWRIEGAWPSSVTYGQMDNSSSDKKTISMTITYDRAYLVR